MVRVVKMDSSIESFACVKEKEARLTEYFICKAAYSATVLVSVSVRYVTWILP